MSQKPEDIVTDEEIEIVHGNARFGSISKRRVVDEGVLKYAFGWSTGATMRQILIEHKLIRVRRPTTPGTLTKKGKKYLRSIQGCSIDSMLDVMGR